MSRLTHDTIVDFIEDILERRGADSYLGEEVTMLQHMLQAACLAEESGADEELICAALLHDIGHYTSEFPADSLESGEDNFHESAGAVILESFFPNRLVDCVRYHVAAKRYLCAIKPDYYEKLSEASKQTLKLQGGPMSKEEEHEFSSRAHLDDVLRVRLWDDQGKDPAKTTPPFSHYRPMLERIVHNHA